MRLFIFFILIVSSRCIFSQHIYYANESKNIGENVIIKWNSLVEISTDGCKKCDTLNEKNDCKTSTSFYKYSLLNDTIFISYKNKDDVIIKSPQYSLNKKDSIIFLREDETGFNSGATCGEIVFVKDTVLVINKKKYPCYLFERTQRRRDNKNKIGYIEIERICLDKKMLIPLLTYTKYFNPFKLKNHKGVYKIKKAIL